MPMHAFSTTMSTYCANKRINIRLHTDFPDFALMPIHMLHKAFKRFPDVKGLILHSDQGAIPARGLPRSPSRTWCNSIHVQKGNCYDNCIMETFFGRLKTEMFYGLEKTYTSFEIFAKAIAEYIDYYNNRRIQVKTKWMPPSAFREASMAMT